MTQLWRAFSYVIPIFLFIIPFIILTGYFIYQKRKKHILQNEAIITVIVDMLLVLSLIGILIVTVFPMGTGLPNRVQLIPFVDITDVLFHSVHVSVPIRNIGLNILLFVPFGLFTSWRLTTKKVLLKILVIGLCLSACVEALQYILPLGRATSIDDVILNTFGTFVGALFFIIISKLLPNRISKISFINLRSSSEKY